MDSVGAVPRLKIITGFVGVARNVLSSFGLYKKILDTKGFVVLQLYTSIHAAVSLGS